MSDRFQIYSYIGPQPCPAGWRIVHADLERDVFTLERSRRWVKGPYRVLTGAEMPRAAGV